MSDDVSGKRFETERRHATGPLPGEHEDTHAKALRTLAEPNRMRIVELLRAGPLTVGEIADRLDLRQPQTSKHLKVLSENEVLDVTVDANRRIYSLRPEPFEALDDWLQSFRDVMEDRFENLDAYLKEIQDAEGS